MQPLTWEGSNPHFIAGYTAFCRGNGYATRDQYSAAQEASFIRGWNFAKAERETLFEDEAEPDGRPDCREFWDQY